MRAGLLASTAIVGLAVGSAAPSFAGVPIVADNYKVSIEGNFRVSFTAADEDHDSVTFPPTDRGYNLAADASEVKFEAEVTLDNGIEYGVEIQIKTQSDDTTNADETWGFVSGFFGRIEIGDQDDAGDRLHIGGEDAAAGRGGFDGDPFDLVATEGSAGPGSANIAAITESDVSATGDATKVIYFTPRVAGIQGGISITPDEEQDGGATPNDADGSFENVVSVGANVAREVSGATMTVSGVGEFGDHETPRRKGVVRYGFGAKVDYMGFSAAGSYVDNGDTGLRTNDNRTESTANGADAGWVVTAAARYATGPWRIGVAWLHGERNSGTFAGTGIEISDPVTDIVSITGDYIVAPGLKIATDLNFFSLDNALSSGGTTAADTNDLDQDGTSYVLSLIFDF